MDDAAGQVEIVVASDPAALAATAADRIVAAAQAAIAERGRFTVALSGGSTPERTYRLLGQSPRREQIDWSHTWIFFGDERCVPHEDARSNYHLAAETLLKPAGIPQDHVFPVPNGSRPAAQSAAEYQATLQRFFGFDASQSAKPTKAGLPAFDFNLLGLGGDGHTASLFPGKPTLDEQNLWVTWSTPGVLPPPVNRVTFTFPLINATRQVMFLVSGEKKASIVHEVLDNPPDVYKHPSSGVHPSNGTLVWLLDEAASKLVNRQQGRAPNK